MLCCHKYFYKMKPEAKDLILRSFIITVIIIFSILGIFDKINKNIVIFILCVMLVINYINVRINYVNMKNQNG